MAATVTPLLTDVTLGESGDDGYWTNADGFDIEIFRQGSSSQSWLVSKNSDETAVYDAYVSNGNAVFDMSGTDVHLFVTIRCDIAPFIDYFHIGLQSDTAHGSATSGTDFWTVVDNTTVIEWAGEWVTLKLDVNSTTKFSTSGTVDLSAITDVHFNIDNSNSGNIRSITNTFIDSVRFGTGLKITGTAWTWEDVYDEDNLTANKYDIIKKTAPGVFSVFGQLQIGDGATTTTPASTNETLGFVDVSTSGIEGGPIGKQAAGFYKVIVTGSGCTCDFNNMDIKASANAPFVFDADDTALPDDSIDWNGGTIIECSSFLSDGVQSFQGMTFSNCGQIEPSTSVFTGFVIDGYTGTDGALLWGGGTTAKDGTIQNSDRAIEVTQTADQVFDNITFPSNTYDVHLNNGGTSIDISKTNGSDPTNYIATGGGVVTFVGAEVTLTVTVKDTDLADIQNAWVTLEAATGGALPFYETVTITSTAGTATVSHNGHGLKTGDLVAIRSTVPGAVQSEYRGVKTITVTTVNAYTYPVVGSPSSPATGVIKATAVVLDGKSNVSGIVTDTFIYDAAQPITGRAYKSTSSPLYQPTPISGSITAAGFTQTAVLVSDE